MKATTMSRKQPWIVYHILRSAVDSATSHDPLVFGDERNFRLAPSPFWLTHEEIEQIRGFLTKGEFVL